MATNFGPSATMLETGPHASLGTFWRRRIAMLPFAKQAGQRPSRRAAAVLLLFAVLTLAAPMVSLSLLPAAPPKVAPGSEPRPAAPQAAANDKPSAEELAAEEAMKFSFAMFAKGHSGGPEEQYVWSRRLMDAQIATNPALGNRLKAAEGHATRMEELREIAKRRVAREQGTKILIVKINFYVAEAERMVAALAAKKADANAVPDQPLPPLDSGAGTGLGVSLPERVAAIEQQILTERRNLQTGHVQLTLSRPNVELADTVHSERRLDLYFDGPKKRFDSIGGGENLHLVSTPTSFFQWGGGKHEAQTFERQTPTPHAAEVADPRFLGLCPGPLCYWKPDAVFANSDREDFRVFELSRGIITSTVPNNLPIIKVTYTIPDEHGERTSVEYRLSPDCGYRPIYLSTMTGRGNRRKGALVECQLASFENGGIWYPKEIHCYTLDFSRPGNEKVLDGVIHCEATFNQGVDQTLFEPDEAEINAPDEPPAGASTNRPSVQKPGQTIKSFEYPSEIELSRGIRIGKEGAIGLPPGGLVLTADLKQPPLPPLPKGTKVEQRAGAGFEGLRFVLPDGSWMVLNPLLDDESASKLEFWQLCQFATVSPAAQRAIADLEQLASKSAGGAISIDDFRALLVRQPAGLSQLDIGLLCGWVVKTQKSWPRAKAIADLIAAKRAAISSMTCTTDTVYDASLAAFDRGWQRCLRDRFVMKPNKYLLDQRIGPALDQLSRRIVRSYDGTVVRVCDYSKEGTASAEIKAFDGVGWYLRDNGILSESMLANSASDTGIGGLPNDLAEVLPRLLVFQRPVDIDGIPCLACADFGVQTVYFLAPQMNFALVKIENSKFGLGGEQGKFAKSADYSERILERLEDCGHGIWLPRQVRSVSIRTAVKCSGKLRPSARSQSIQ